MMLDVKIDQDHNYIVNCPGGKQTLPSVTTILNDVLPQFPVDEWYLERGRAIHKCAQLIAQKKTFRYDPKIDLYVKGIYKFFEEVKPEISDTEVVTYSLVYRYGGTIDAIGTIGKRKVLIDYKTNNVDYGLTMLQLAAYSIAIKEQTGVDVTWGLGIAIRDTNYDLTKITNLKYYKHKFLACRSVYNLRTHK